MNKFENIKQIIKSKSKYKYKEPPSKKFRFK